MENRHHATYPRSLPAQHSGESVFYVGSRNSCPSGIRPVGDEEQDEIRDSIGEEDVVCSRGLQEIVLQASPENTFRRRLAGLWENKALSDLILVCQGTEVKVHKVVLVIHSVYFHRKLITQNGVDIKSMALDEKLSLLERCLEFMYTSKTEVQDMDLDDLTSLAYKLEITDLYSRCRGIQLENVVIVEENCLEIWNEGILIRNDDLIQKARTMALSRFADMGTQRGDRVASLSWECVLDLLANENLEIENDDERLSEALGWVNRDPSNRLDRFGDLLTSLPLHDMSDWFLGHILGDHLIKDHPTAKGIIQEAREITKKQRKLSRVAVNDDEHFRHSLVVIGYIDPSSEGQARASSEIRVVSLIGNMPSKTLTNLPAPISNHGGVACCASRDTIFVSGLGSDENEAWVFLLVSMRWEQCGKLKSPRECHAMAVCEDKVYVLGGRKPKTRSTLANSVEVLNSTKKHWSTAGKLTGSGCATNTCACTSGSDIIVCGITDELEMCTLAVFSPKTRTTTHCVVIPGGMSWVYGVDVMNDSVIVCSSKNTFTCALSRLYENSAADVTAHDKLKTPNSSCAMVLNKESDKVMLIGGMPKVKIHPFYAYETSVENIIDGDYLLWKSLRPDWPLSGCYIVGGAYCVADLCSK